MNHNTPPEDEATPLIAHLTELRQRLVRALAGFLLATLLCYGFAAEIYGFLTAPLARALGARGQDAALIYTGLHEAFFTYLRLALFGGFILSFPVTAFQLWRFVAPGLYRSERKAFLPFLVASPLLFLAGASLVYFLVMPLAIDFFLDFQETGAPTTDAAAGAARSTASIGFLGKVNEYLRLVMTFILAFGLCFQLPVLLTLLGRAGLATSAMLASRRKYAIVGIAMVGAILTPPDPISQIGLAVPIYGLYELSIHLMRATERKREAEAAREGST